MTAGNSSKSSKGNNGGGARVRIVMHDEQPCTLRHALQAVAELQEGVEGRFPELGLDVEATMKAAGHAWIADKRAGDQMARLSELVMCANAHRAGVAHACRDLWRGTLREAKARYTAGRDTLSGASKALSEIAGVYVHLHVFFPAFQFRESPPEAAMDAFRTAVSMAVRKHMLYVHIVSILHRMMDLAHRHITGDLEKEPELDMGLSVMMPLRDALAEYDPDNLNAVTGFLTAYARRPDWTIRWMEVESKIVTNEMCLRDAPRRLGGGGKPEAACAICGGRGEPCRCRCSSSSNGGRRGCIVKL